jgi:hypothetical protein
MKVTKIKGRDYIEVNERLKHFRSADQYKGYSLETEVVSITDDKCVLKAIIKDQEERVVATGLAYEDHNAGMVNKTSYIENCETSAWGRALGNLGIGIDTSVASADEVNNAIAAQSKMNKAVKTTKKAGFVQAPENMPIESVVSMMQSTNTMDQLKQLWADNWKNYTGEELTALEQAKEANKKRLSNQ